MRWLVENWHALLAKPWDAIALAFLALLSGAWVGTERQRREKAAGVRTMALVALGSCTFTLVGYAFTSNTGDSGRVAAQIVTGDEIKFSQAAAALRNAAFADALASRFAVASRMMVRCCGRSSLLRPDFSASR